MAPRNLVVWVGGGAVVEGSSQGVDTIHGYVVVLWLSLRRRYGDRGVEEGAALRDFRGLKATKHKCMI